MTGGLEARLIFLSFAVKTGLFVRQSLGELQANGTVSAVLKRQQNEQKKAADEKQIFR